MESKRIEEAVSAILKAVGDDPTREGLRETPRRVAAMYAEVLDGIGKDPLQVFSTTFHEEKYKGAVVLRDIPFFSMCEHHLLPFFGRAHIGYVPGDKIAGASKIARALDVLSHRLQLQERLTEQLVDALFQALEPDGVAVVLEAEHLCMTMRGVKKMGSFIVTSATRGPFSRESPGREGLLSMLSAG